MVAFAEKPPLSGREAMMKGLSMLGVGPEEAAGFIAMLDGIQEAIEKARNRATAPQSEISRHVTPTQQGQPPKKVK